MPDGFDDDQDSSEVQPEAVVEMANLTNGMMGGMFDRSRDSSRGLGLSRPRSTAIWVRVVSAITAMVLGVLFVASPLVLALTIGPMPGVTIGLGAAAVAAGIVFAGSYAAERREIVRRTAREEE